MDDEAKKRIKQVVDYAENHPLTFTKLKQIQEGVVPPPGDDTNYRCALEKHYLVVYTIDQVQHRETKEFNWFRHISITLRNKEPPIPAVAMIIKEFGFKGTIKDCIVYLENQDDPTKPQAVNLMQPYDSKELDDH